MLMYYICHLNNLWHLNLESKPPNTHHDLLLDVNDMLNLNLHHDLYKHVLKKIAYHFHNRLHCN